MAEFSPPSPLWTTSRVKAKKKRAAAPPPELVGAQHLSYYSNSAAASASSLNLNNNLAPPPPQPIRSISDPNTTGRGEDAPYLTHVVHHHGKLTLVAPDNLGARRQPAQADVEPQPEPEPEPGPDPIPDEPLEVIEVEDELPPAYPLVYSARDPFVVAWDDDRTAGIGLDERIARDLERRGVAVQIQQEEEEQAQEEEPAVEQDQEEQEEESEESDEDDVPARSAADAARLRAEAAERRIAASATPVEEPTPSPPPLPPALVETPPPPALPRRPFAVPQTRSPSLRQRIEAFETGNAGSSPWFANRQERPTRAPHYDRPLPVPPERSDRVDALTVLRARQEALASLTRRSNSMNDVAAIIGQTQSPPRPRPEQQGRPVTLPPQSSSLLEPPASPEVTVNGRTPSILSASSAEDGEVNDTAPPPPRQGPSTGAVTPGLSAYSELDVLLARLEYPPDEAPPGADYDDLLLVSELMGTAKAPGCTPEELETLAVGKVELERRRVNKNGKTKSKMSIVGVRCVDCAICLARFKPDESALVLPRCLHPFHAECTLRWLREKRTCPTCREEVFEPQEEPLVAV